MSRYTCITCRVAFKDPEIQRLHYKLDWHRYNLQRKVAEIPPITSEEFQKRVLLQRGKDVETPKAVYCEACKKSFSTSNAFQNHLNSKKHIENALVEKTTEKSDKTGENNDKNESKFDESLFDDDDDSEIEEVDSDEWDEDTENPIDDNNCLFCNHHSRTLSKNLVHMSKAHTFFIPDIEYCFDIKGLLLYLGEKITQGYICLWCNDRGKTFYSVDSVRQHMLDKGHCKMLHEGVALAEYTNFYDYSSSYPDAEEENVDTEADIEVDILDDSEFQLVLPSGITIGHRSLMRYYKQNIDPSKAQVVPKSNKKLHKVLASYRAIGWTATQQEAAARKARDIHFMRRMQSKLYTKLGVKANKFQKHFRVQVSF